MKRHIERKHPNMSNYLNIKSNKTFNISTEFQNNTTNISVFDRFAPLIKMNPVWNEKISRLQEVLEKIKQMDNDEINYVIIFAMYWVHKRGMTYRHSNNT